MDVLLVIGLILGIFLIHMKINKIRKNFLRNAGMELLMREKDKWNQI